MSERITTVLYELYVQFIENIYVGQFGSGYVPPEYVQHGLYSMKYDVYSFGVVLLQIISSKRINDNYGLNEDWNLLEYVILPCT